MYDLADCYYDGEGVDKNIPLSSKWMTKAADAGYPKAQVAIGVAYLLGANEIEQNYALAERFLQMAAMKDNTEAQGYLSFLYVNMEDYEKALLWGRKAAQMGDPTACTVLGRIFNEGLGVEIDHIQALKWYEGAADKGDADAQNIVGNMYSGKDLGVLDLKKAFKYYKKAAEQDHIYGMFNLGLCYAEGDGCPKDMRKALNWIEKAENEACPEAQQWMSKYNQSLQDQEKPKEEKKSSPKRSSDKKKQIVVSKEIPDVKIDKIKKEDKNSIYFSITYNNYIGRLLKCVFTYKPLHDGSIVSYERYFKIDKDILIELFEDEEYSTGLLCKGHFFWFEHIKFGDFTFNDYGDYYYKSNLSVYDDNNNLLSSYDFDLTIQYVHKIFGSDEIKIKEIH